MEGGVERGNSLALTSLLIIIVLAKGVVGPKTRFKRKEWISGQEAQANGEEKAAQVDGSRSI